MWLQAQVTYPTGPSQNLAVISQMSGRSKGLRRHGGTGGGCGEPRASPTAPSVGTVERRPRYVRCPGPGSSGRQRRRPGGGLAVVLHAAQPPVAPVLALPPAVQQRWVCHSQDHRTRTGTGGSRRRSASSRATARPSQEVPSGGRGPAAPGVAGRDCVVTPHHYRPAPRVPAVRATAGPAHQLHHRSPGGQPPRPPPGKKKSAGA